MMLVYDLDSPNDERNKYCILMEALVWDILIQGVLQPLIAVFIASIVCPVISLSVLFGENYLCILKNLLEFLKFSYQFKLNF
jgi:hypothetical protein